MVQRPVAPSHPVDTVLFISIAYFGTVPAGTLWNLMYTQYLIKVGIAVIDTPIVYALVSYLRPRIAPTPEDIPASLEHTNP